MTRATLRSLTHLCSVLLLGGVAACAGGAAPSAAAPAPRGAPIDPALALATFDSAWTRIHRTYYDSTFKGMNWHAVRDELRPRVVGSTDEEVVRDAIREMLDRIGDSHFALLLRQDEATLDPEATAGVEGDPAEAGLELRVVEGRVTVFQLDPEGAAARAGVRPGWVVESVRGREVAPWLAALDGVEDERARVGAELGVLGQVLGLFHGSEGERIEARFRDAQDRPVELALALAPPRGDPVRFGNLPTVFVRVDEERLAVPEGCVGVIRFNVWMPNVRPGLERALDALADCTGMIVDLRGNPGGVGALAMGAAGAFLDESVTFGVMRTRQNELRYVSIPRRVDSAARPTRPFDGPLAILVDESSVSTSEIFAAGMQAVGRARVFGVTTPGMALPALMVRLPNDDVLYHAIADFEDPNGLRIEGRGAVPDQHLPLARADLLAGRDRVQEAAVEWIRGLTPMSKENDR